MPLIGKTCGGFTVDCLSSWRRSGLMCSPLPNEVSVSVCALSVGGWECVHLFFGKWRRRAVSLLSANKIDAESDSRMVRQFRGVWRKFEIIHARIRAAFYDSTMRRCAKHSRNLLTWFYWITLFRRLHANRFYIARKPIGPSFPPMQIIKISSTNIIIFRVENVG